jgi:hypothetical protein
VSRARRVGLLVCGVVLLGVAVLPRAIAQAPPDPTTPTEPTTPTTTEPPTTTTEPSSRWDAEWYPPLEGDTGTAEDAAVAISGWFSYGPASTSAPVGISQISLSIEPDADLPSGCTVPDPAPERYDSNGADPGSRGRIRQEFAFDDLEFACNGRYSVVATAYLGDFGSDPEPSAPSSTRHRLHGTLDVAAPAPAVSGLAVSVSPDGKTVHLTWDAIGDQPPDFEGYQVMRAAGDGDFAAAGTPTTSTTATDEPAAGHYRYAVVSVRRGPDGEPVMSPLTTAAARNVTVGAVTAPTRPTYTRGTGGVALSRPRSGAVARRGASGPPTTADTGYKETLDYGNARLPGADGEGELGSGVVHIIGDPARKRGIVIPAAAAMVLALWAAHFRYLAHRARLPEV